MRNYTREIRAKHNDKIYREVIAFSDLGKDGNKIVVELSRGYRKNGEYIAVDVQRLDSNGIYSGALDLNPQAEWKDKTINGVKCAIYVLIPGWVLEPTPENEKKILDEIARRAFGSK